MMKKIISVCLGIVLLFAGAHSTQAAPIDSLQKKMGCLRWVAYAPTHFDPVTGRYPSEDSIAADLALLRNYGFDAIVTYGSLASLGEIPRIAVSLGFKGVIMGIWDISSDLEYRNAVAAAAYVDGYCVGNEGLHSRYSPVQLSMALARIKSVTGKPATTSEQVFDYAINEIAAIGDWVFPTTHPFLNGTKDPSLAAQWIKKHFVQLSRHAQGRPVFIKEAGYPTAGASMASEVNQRDFLLFMEAQGIPFVFFEAFDQPWKVELSVEPHWGLFSNARHPKKFAAKILH